MIGMILIFLMTMKSYIENSSPIFVNTRQELKRLKRKSKIKRYFFIVCAFIYIDVITYVIVPYITHSSMKPNLWSILIFLIPLLFLIFYDDKRIQLSTQFKSSEENRKNKVSPILKLIPQYMFSDDFQRTMIEIDYAKNFVWVAPTLILIAMIDIVIEVCISQQPYAAILTHIVLLIEIIVSIIKVQIIKRQHTHD